MSAVPQLKPFQWRPGQSGNPAGPGVGYRKKLEEIFLKDLHASWKEHGNQAIQAAIEKDPVGYVKVIASLMPKQIEPESGLDGISRDELRTAIDAIQRFIAPRSIESLGSEVSEPGSVIAISGLPEAG